MAFWGKALTTLVHVWNQCPTVALDNAIPYELWHGCKPDVFHLWVWGLTAYVHIQKDKCSTLHPHYEKCIFIGYSDGYKGWKFYNLTTKYTIIFECTDFDKCTTISLPTSILPHEQAPAPPYTAPDIEDISKTTLWMLLGFCILGRHLILLGTRIQNPTPHLQCLDHSQMLLRLHLLHLSLCRPLLALVHACLEKSASDLKNGGNSVQHSSSTMTWITLMTKKQILPTVLPSIQHILGHLEMPWSKMMLWSGDKLLWMNWLPIRQMGHGLLLIDLRINQSLGQSGSLPRNIMLMAPLSTRGLLGCTGLLSAFSIRISRGIHSNSAPTHSMHHPCTCSHPQPPSLVCWCLKCISQWQNELGCLYGAAKRLWIGRLQEDSVFAQKSAIWHQTRWKQVESQDAHHFQILGLQTDIFWYCCLYFCLRWCPDHPACLCG